MSAEQDYMRLASRVLLHPIFYRVIFVRVVASGAAIARMHRTHGYVYTYLHHRDALIVWQQQVAYQYY